MPRVFSVTIQIILLCTVMAAAQTKPLKNSDVVEMFKAGLPESTIVLSIQRSRSDFDVSPDALIKLKKEGATEKILDAVVRANSLGGLPGTFAEDAFGTSLGSSIVLADGTNRTQLKRMTPISKTNSAVRAIPYVGIFMKGKTYAVFNGGRSDVRSRTSLPEFEIGISSDLKISDAVYIVRLEASKDTRRSEVMRMGDLGGSTGARKKDIVPITIEELPDRTPQIFGITFYRITTATRIPPGEYALVVNGNLFYDFGTDWIGSLMGCGNEKASRFRPALFISPLNIQVRT